MKDDKISTITVKREMTRVKYELNTQLQERLFNFRHHIFNINYRELRRRETSNAVWMERTFLPSLN